MTKLFVFLVMCCFAELSFAWKVPDLPEGYNWCAFGDREGSHCATKSKGGECHCDALPGQPEPPDRTPVGEVVFPKRKWEKPPVLGEDIPAYSPMSGYAPKGYRWCFIGLAKTCLTSAKEGECHCENVPTWDQEDESQKGFVFGDLGFDPNDGYPYRFPKEGYNSFCLKVKWNSDDAAPAYIRYYVEAVAVTCTPDSKRVKVTNIKMLWRFTDGTVGRKECRDTESCVFEERVVGTAKSVRCAAATAFNGPRRAWNSTLPYECK